MQEALQAFQDVSLECERQVGASQRFEFSLNRDIVIVINEITKGERDEREELEACLPFWLSIVTFKK